ncbi:hypothetical protein [Clostridium aminobutyricum]|uniref:Tail fiber protein n=1 Tax=Clostridium aminobutyricum TaxID=33953 RepID=A0A939D8N7_CLOAM|nr:hypothetical protein [Clostridium aminobutyricum]MBN7773160.1 hypothetical protein [Clostridium aminobutyricum]
MATKTANYNLVKPLGKEKVDVDVINANMDAIDTAMKGLDNSKVTVANNLTTVEAGHALDAVQGKVLADSISAVNSALSKEATQSLKGLMSVVDKIKLDGVEAGANKYIHPSTSGNKHLPSGGAVGQIPQNTADGTATWRDLVAVEAALSATVQTLYGVANVDAALQKTMQGGLLSALLTGFSKTNDMGDIVATDTLVRALSKLSNNHLYAYGNFTTDGTANREINVGFSPNLVMAAGYSYNASYKTWVGRMDIYTPNASITMSNKEGLGATDVNYENKLVVNGFVLNNGLNGVNGGNTNIGTWLAFRIL